jgi:trehalose 6-phosphate synthase/phosphatase
VTPGITRETYDSEQSEEAEGGVGLGSPSYFSSKDIDHAIAASPAPVEEGKSFEDQVATGANEGKEYLRRLSLAVMGGRRESLSDIRATSPDLSLSGNIISATFNIPHSLKYRKGADWVSSVQLGPPLTAPSCFSTRGQV